MQFQPVWNCKPDLHVKYVPLSPITGPKQSMKIDDKKINLSIDGNRIRLVN